MIIHIVAGGSLTQDTFLHMLDSLSDCEILTVRCHEHKTVFTKLALSFYLKSRSHFIAKRHDTMHDDCRMKSNKCRKDPKL